MSLSGSCSPTPTGLPSASVAPEPSTTWMIASAWRRWSRNWLPRPRPVCASGTSPATSIRLIGMNRTPSVQLPQVAAPPGSASDVHGQGART